MKYTRPTIAIAALAATAISVAGLSAPAQAFTSDVNVDWKITQDWGSGFQGSVTVKNTSTKSINPWSVSIPYANTISSTWDATATSTTGGYRFSGLGGAMLWELSGDRDEELIDVIGANLK